MSKLTELGGSNFNPADIQEVTKVSVSPVLCNPFLYDSRIEIGFEVILKDTTIYYDKTYACKFWSGKEKVLGASEQCKKNVEAKRKEIINLWEKTI